MKTLSLAINESVRWIVQLINVIHALLPVFAVIAKTGINYSMVGSVELTVLLMTVQHAALLVTVNDVITDTRWLRKANVKLSAWLIIVKVVQHPVFVSNAMMAMIYMMEDNAK